jgi:hypothetical protein
MKMKFELRYCVIRIRRTSVKKMCQLVTEIMNKCYVAIQLNVFFSYLYKKRES